MFERIEQGFFRRILNAHSKTPVECLYLELGVVPFRFSLSARRISYYHTVIQRDDSELTKKVMLMQKKSKYPGDIYQLIEQDMNMMNICETDIMTMGKETLKELIKKRISVVAFDHLHKIAESHS